uniref:Uncharacterized protein n=1 Tax=viral metagenome TaxID=1070528 RepID=A0A6C0KH03_9ZZZZ
MNKTNKIKYSLDKDLIQKTFYDKFKNNIIKTINSDDPNINWIVDLYKEIKNKMISLLKVNSELYNEIDEYMDTCLFKQMITHKAHTSDDIVKLIYYVFHICKKLGSPSQDKVIDKKLDEIKSLLQKENIDIGNIVATFIIYANESLDKIYEQLHLFLNNIPVSKEQ